MNRGKLFWEGLVIVVSILLAFAIDAWWDDRKERIEEEALLTGLEIEFRANRETLEHQLAANLNMLDSITLLLQAARDGAWPEGEQTFDYAVSEMMRPPTTDLGGGVLRAVMSAGRLPLISNQELRYKLAAWEGIIGEVIDDELMGRTLVFNALLPFFIERGVPLSKGWNAEPWTDGWPVQPSSLTEDPAALTKLLEEPGFQTILEARYVFWAHTTGEYRAAIAAIDEILEEIEQTQ